MNATRQRKATGGEVVAGLIERIAFQNADSGFCVLRVDARGQRDPVTVVGYSPAAAPGGWITAAGEWTNHPKHGPQFKAAFIRNSAPSTTEGARKYLASGTIRGIGKRYAERLIEAFGGKVFDIIATEPERLREVDGIGPVRAKRITDAWAEHKATNEIMVFLQEHGAGAARAVRIFEKYGTDALEKMTLDPYCLARDIRGIGFQLADNIAMKLGIEKTAMSRVRAGISYALDEARKNGHCGLPHDELHQLAAELLDVPGDLIGSAVDLELKDDRIVDATVANTRCIFASSLYRAERGIAERLITLAAGRPPWPEIDADAVLPRIEKRTGLKLAAAQADALRLALRSKTTIITGGPGVGKTTLLDAILRILTSSDVSLKLCAPTGRAARRMNETTGIEARTIHRLLEVDPETFRFKRNEENPLRCDLLVVDEASMVDVPLMRALLAAVPRHAALLIVGDIDQLPSVGPGQVLADIIGSGTVPVVRLTEIFRQAAKSRIITSAHHINHNVIPDLSRQDAESDFHFVPAPDPETAAAHVVELVSNRIPKRFGLDPVDDVQVLCPMNAGGAGTRALNNALQEALNPNRTRKIERFGVTFAPGDKVMQTVNDYEKEVYNGDVGHVVDVNEEDRKLSAEFDGNKHDYQFQELDALRPAYAATVHKSQGSEYPAVVIPMLTQHYRMLRKNLLYTGITRGKKLVILVGQKKAIAIAVRHGDNQRRWSKLEEWLRHFAGNKTRTAAPNRCHAPGKLPLETP